MFWSNPPLPKKIGVFSFYHDTSLGAAGSAMGLDSCCGVYKYQCWANIVPTTHIRQIFLKNFKNLKNKGYGSEYFKFSTIVSAYAEFTTKLQS